MAAAVSVKDLTFAFAGVGAFSIGPVSLEVQKGHVVGIVGPSGCGKTTFLRLIAGLLPNDPAQRRSGTLVYPDLDRAQRRHTTMLFQTPFLLPNLTVLQNVTAPFAREATDRSNDAKELLGQIGLHGKLHALPEELSGGMKSRVALVRALLLAPQLLLMDEPFIGLDVRFRETAYQLIEDFVDANGTTVVLVSHDLEEVWRMCSTVLVFHEDGKSVTALSELKNRNFADVRSAIICAFSNRETCS